jgi:hypothetical protein
MENILFFKFINLPDQTTIDVIQFEPNGDKCAYVFKSLHFVFTEENFEKTANQFYHAVVNDVSCFKSKLDPWDDMRESIPPNTCFIIAYNTQLKAIQGWCNLFYDIDDKDHPDFKKLSLDKIVTRSIPELPCIGTLLMNIIHDCYMESDISLLYLFSIPSAIEFYKKIQFLTQYRNNPDYTHIFYKLKDKYRGEVPDYVKQVWEDPVNKISPTTKTKINDDSTQKSSCKQVKEKIAKFQIDDEQEHLYDIDSFEDLVQLYQTLYPNTGKRPYSTSSVIQEEVKRQKFQHRDTLTGTRTGTRTNTKRDTLTGTRTNTRTHTHAHTH